MKKLYSKKLGGEAFALDAAQLDTLKKAGYTVPSPEEVIADAAAVKIEPPEGKRAYVVFDFKTGAFKVRTRTQTLAESEVVLNRTLSDYFPDTVEEVVFQKYGDVWQFSPAPYLYSAEPDKEQYLAVHTAIEEREHILSEDTVYFSTAPYNESVDMIIGNHYFCKIF